MSAPLRWAAAVVTAICVAVLAAACGSPQSPGTGGAAPSGSSSSSSAAVAFSQCMRTHGVTKFPDPGSDGELPKVGADQLGVSSATYQSAQKSCQDLVSNGSGSLNSESVQLCLMSGNCSPALLQTLMNGMLKFSRCMRSHGVPNFPDPTVNSQGQPGIDLVDVPGTDWDSSRIGDKLHECGQLLPNVRVGLERP